MLARIAKHNFSCKNPEKCNFLSYMCEQYFIKFPVTNNSFENFLKIKPRKMNEQNARNQT